MKKLEQMTEHEKTLRRIIIGIRNEIIGGYENMYSDEPDFFLENVGEDITKEDVVNEIYERIMNTNNQIVMHPDNFLIQLESKHIHFMGKAFVRELIENRVESNYRKYGWDFPNNYEGK